MNKVYWFLKIKVRFLATLLLCFAAVYVVAGRILFLYLPDYQNDIVTILSAELGRPVTLESIEGHWSGFDPVIQLNELNIGGAKTVRAEAVNVRLGLLSSLRSGTIRLRSLELLKTEFDAVQHADYWQVAGYDLTTSAGETPRLDNSMLRTFLEGTNISFIDTRIDVVSNQGDQRQWRLPSVSLRYQGDEVYASGQVVQPGSLSPLMSISFHGDGVLSDQPVRGEIYLEARSVDFLDTVLSNYQWQGLSLAGIDASGRIWADFEDFALLDLQGEIQASRIDWMVGQQKQDPVRNLAAQFLWHAEDSGQTLAVNNLAWNWRELSCLSSNGVMKQKRTQEQERIELYLDQLEVGCLNGLLLASDLPQGLLFDRLDISQPQGRMQDINVRLLSPVDGHSTRGIAESDQKYVQGVQTQEEAEKTQLASSSDTQESHAEAAQPKEIVAKAEPGSRDDQSGQREQSVETDTEKNAALEGIASGFVLEARLSDVSLAAYESTPSAAGIDGYLYVDENQGRVEFKSRNFKLGFPDLFLDSWKMERAQGIVHWQIRGEDIDVYSDGLQLVMPDQGLIYGDFLLRLNNDLHEDYLGLSIALQDIPFEKVIHFVPYHEVDSELYRWLEQGLQSGLVTHGAYFGYGSVEDDDAINSYTSSLQVDVREGHLKFDPEWPMLSDLDAHIELQDDKLDVVADRASIHDTDLFGLKAHMPSAPEGAYPVLQARAKALTQGSNLEYWMAESPVAEHTAALSEALSIEGVLEVDIDISVPMGDEPVQYQVATRFKDNQIRHGLSGLTFTSLDGLIEISSSQGVTAEGITLQLFEQPAQLSIAPISLDHSGAAAITAFRAQDGRPDPDAGQRYTGTRLVLSSRADIDRILRHFEMAPVLGVQGPLSYQAMLNIYQDEAIPPELRIVSQLEGLQRNWPAPYAKTAASREKLQADIRFEDAATRVKAVLESQTGGPIDAHLYFRESSLESANIFLGGSSGRGYQPVEGRGLAIQGRVTQADLQEWIDFIQALQANSEKDAAWPGFNSIDLGIQSLSAYGQAFNDLSLTTKPQEEGWRLHVLGKQLQGLIVLPDDARSLSLDLDRIHLSTEDKTDAVVDPETTPSVEAPGIDPRSIPAMSFATKELVLNGQDYGRWSTVVVPDEQGLKLHKLKGKVGDIGFDGQLHWSQEELDRTYLELKISGKDIETFFSAIDIPAPLSSESVNGDLALVWQAAPYEFDAEKLSGSFNAKMENGFLHTSDKDTGALRLLGIFNADALARRLKLDFSDIYKSGIGYDDLNMRAKIDQGTLRFAEPMTIEGPSSKYQISGSSNLAKRSLDLDMYVELPLASNVPLAALILGAPQIGGAVWLVDKLLGEPLSSITSAKYRVKGSWDAPKLELK